MTTKQEWLAMFRDRFRGSSKTEKSRILDEFGAVTGQHRKHGILLLGQSGDPRRSHQSSRVGASTASRSGNRRPWLGKPLTASVAGA